VDDVGKGEDVAVDARLLLEKRGGGGSVHYVSTETIFQGWRMTIF
jgi:hypothetical protein